MVKLAVLIPAYGLMSAVFLMGALLGPTLVFLVPILFLPMAGLISGAHVLADMLVSGERPGSWLPQGRRKTID
jgi:hypothetical protein